MAAVTDSHFWTLLMQKLTTVLDSEAQEATGREHALPVLTAVGMEDTRICVITGHREEGCCGSGARQALSSSPQRQP